MFSIEINNASVRWAVDRPADGERSRRSCATPAYARELSVAVVDDPTIHELNRQFLDHDYPTDVLSFLLERDGDALEGEVVVSADTRGPRRSNGWPADDELLLYVDPRHAAPGRLRRRDATSRGCQHASGRERYRHCLDYGGRTAAVLRQSPIRSRRLAMPTASLER